MRTAKGRQDTIVKTPETEESEHNAVKKERFEYGGSEIF